MSSDRRSGTAAAAGGPAGRLDREKLAHSLALYAVTDRHWLGERTLDSCVREALRGGATFMQVREKDDMALPHDEYLAEAREDSAAPRPCRLWWTTMWRSPSRARRTACT